MRSACMTVLMAIVSFLWFFGCGLPLALACEEGNTRSARDAIYVKVGQGAPCVSLTVESDKIAVNDAGDPRKLLQEIPYDAAASPNLGHSVRINAEDVNFDGYTDLRILVSGGSANAYYDFWLWNPARQKFVFHAALSKLSSPKFDAQSKTVCSFTHISATDSTVETYRFQDGQLRLARIIERIYDGQERILAVRQYDVDENGDRHLVSEEKIVPPGMRERTPQ
jgi:hypothetical protein